MINIYCCYIFIFYFIFTSSAVPTYKNLFEEATNNNDWVVDKRRWLHQHPELCFKEYETSKFIKSILKSMNINYSENWGVNSNDPDAGHGTGIIAEIGTGYPPCVAYRADIDALPLTENVNISFPSLNPGVMHACGHDAHTAMLLGIAKILKNHESEIKGTVRLIFQPAEENVGGASMMVKEGVLKKFPPVERIFGQHVYPQHPSGTINTNGNTLQAGSDTFEIFIKGKGGHAASHHMAHDPLVAASAMVRNLYDIHSRELFYDIDYSGVISVAYIDAGTTATNVVPETAVIGGTIRATKAKTMEHLKQRIEEVSQFVSTAYKCTSNVTFNKVPYPILENDPELFEFFNEISGDDFEIIDVEPVMTAEDYSYYSNEVPSLYLHLGIGSGFGKNDQPRTDFPLHSAEFAVDETVFPLGVAVNSHLVFQSIEQLSKTNDPTSHNEF